MSQQYRDPNGDPRSTGQIQLPPTAPPTPQASSPKLFGVDRWTIAAIAAALLAAFTCFGAVGLAFLLAVLVPPPPPATAPPAAAAVVPAADVPTTVINLAPQATIPPTVDSASVGQFVNPYLSANLAGMTVIQIDIRDATTGNYVRTAQLTTDSDLQKFTDALNVSIKTVAPDTSCPDHVRLSITRADSSVVTMGICLNKAVILRGDIPGLNGTDAPMYPGFTDVLLPYLPDAYKQLLTG